MGPSYLKDGSQQIQGVSGTALIFVWITVTARCYVRIVMIKKFGIEDWFALASLISFTVYIAFTLDGSLHAYGRQLVDLSPENEVRGLDDWWSGTIAYLTTSGFLKASIAMQLLNLTDRKSYRNSIYIVLGISVAYTLAFFIFLMSHCSPIKDSWDIGICVEPDLFAALMYTHATCNIAADLFFSIIPWFLIRNLELPPKTKFTLSAILALGGLASCVVIIRLPYIYLLDQNIGELLYNCTWIINLATAENGLGISAAALATLRPLFRDLYVVSRSLTPARLVGSSSIHQKGSAATSRNPFASPYASPFPSPLSHVVTCTTNNNTYRHSYRNSKQRLSTLNIDSIASTPHFYHQHQVEEHELQIHEKDSEIGSVSAEMERVSREGEMERALLEEREERGRKHVNSVLVIEGERAEKRDVEKGTWLDLTLKSSRSTDGLSSSDDGPFGLEAETDAIHDMRIAQT